MFAHFYLLKEASCHPRDSSDDEGANVALILNFEKRFVILDPKGRFPCGCF
jgi:hypothetical protein